MNLATDIQSKVTALGMFDAFAAGMRHHGGESAFLSEIPHSVAPPPPGGQVRYRREHASGRQLPFFTFLEDLMRDVCDGAALLTVVHSYCPEHIKLEGKFSFNTLGRVQKQINLPSFVLFGPTTRSAVSPLTN